MIHAAVRCSRAVAATIRCRTTVASGPAISAGSLIRYSTPLSQQLRLIHGDISVPNANQVAIQMVNYALSHARSQKSDESYAQGMLVLEQCLGNQPDEDQVAQDSKATVLLAMSDLLYESGNSSVAIERLKQLMTLTLSSLDIRVVAVESLVGLLIQSGQDDASLDVANEFMELVKGEEAKRSHENLHDVAATAYALKGMVELVKGSVESAGTLFQELENHESCKGNIALSYGEYLHAAGNFEMAKEMYQKAIQGVAERKESMCSCNMNLQAVSLAASFAFGQLESHIGNFGDAEDTLTSALTRAEEHYGHNHPKVGVILTGVALMFRNKAKQERSSSLLIQEGLFRRALDLMKAPPLESKVVNMEGGDVMALARGGYAELLVVQEKRKEEGEKMKAWAEAMWRNKRISLSEALTCSETSGKVAIVDARTSRVL